MGSAYGFGQPLTPAAEPSASAAFDASVTRTDDWPSLLQGGATNGHSRDRPSHERAFGYRSVTDLCTEKSRKEELHEEITRNYLTSLPPAYEASFTEERVTDSTPPPQFPELRASSPIFGLNSRRGVSLTSLQLGHSRQLCDGVHLAVRSYTAKKGRERRVYSVTNSKLSRLEFSIDLSEFDVREASWLQTNSSNDSLRRRTIQTGAREVAEVGTVDYLWNPNISGQEPRLRCEWRHFPGPDKLSASYAIDDDIKNEVLRMYQFGITGEKLSTAGAIVQACKRAGIAKFIDVSFPPCEKVIYGDLRPKSLTSIVWRRASDILGDEGKQVHLFGERHAHPCDIKPGALGDNWFLAALAALAEHAPSLLAGVFGSAAASPEGVYAIRCWKHGVETTVIIDDYFPCCAMTGQPCFSCTRNGEIWVPLLEKAWAKLHGSYSSLEGGLVFRAMMEISGLAGKCLPLQPALANSRTPQGSHQTELRRQRELTRVLHSLLAAGDVTVATCSGGPGVQEGEDAVDPPEDDLPGHAFVVLKIQEVEGTILFRLRNPWNSFDWNGKWCNSSLRWTQAAMEQAKHNPDEEDGTFWLSEEEVFRYFSHFHILHCRAGHAAQSENVTMWQHLSHTVHLVGPRGEQQGLVSALQLMLPAPMEGLCAVWQRNRAELVNDTVAHKQIAFAIYGPLHSVGREVVRTNAWASRELVAAVPRMEPGLYWVTIWCCDSEAGRAVTAAEALDEFIPRECEPATFHTYLEPSPRCDTEAQPTKVAKRDAVTLLPLRLQASQPIESYIIGDAGVGNIYDHSHLSFASGWLPDRSFAIAVRSKAQHGHHISLRVDFTRTVGMELIPGIIAKILQPLSLELLVEGTDWHLVTTLVPKAAEQRIRYHATWVPSWLAGVVRDYGVTDSFGASIEERQRVEEVSHTEPIGNAGGYTVLCT